MKVAHILNGGFFGGTEMMLYKLIKHSAHVQHHVATLLQSGPASDMIRDLGVSVDTSMVVRNGFPSPRGLSQLTKSLRAFQPDVIQSWAYHADLAGAYVAKRLGRPVVWGYSPWNT